MALRGVPGVVTAARPVAWRGPGQRCTDRRFSAEPAADQRKSAASRPAAGMRAESPGRGLAEIPCRAGKTGCACPGSSFSRVIVVALAAYGGGALLAALAGANTPIPQQQAMVKPPPVAQPAAFGAARRAAGAIAERPAEARTGGACRLLPGAGPRRAGRGGAIRCRRALRAWGRAGAGLSQRRLVVSRRRGARPRRGRVQSRRALREGARRRRQQDRGAQLVPQRRRSEPPSAPSSIWRLPMPTAAGRTRISPLRRDGTSAPPNEGVDLRRWSIWRSFARRATASTARWSTPMPGTAPPANAATAARSGALANCSSNSTTRTKRAPKASRLRSRAALDAAAPRPDRHRSRRAAPRP